MCKVDIPERIPVLRLIPDVILTMPPPVLLKRSVGVSSMGTIVAMLMFGLLHWFFDQTVVSNIDLMDIALVSPYPTVTMLVTRNMDSISTDYMQAFPQNSFGGTSAATIFQHLDGTFPMSTPSISMRQVSLSTLTFHTYDMC